MILPQHQAQAVYSAMCALNNVGGFIGTAHIPDDVSGDLNITVKSCEPGTVAVQLWDRTFVIDEERYSSQAAFAATYGV